MPGAITRLLEGPFLPIAVSLILGAIGVWIAVNLHRARNLSHWLVFSAWIVFSYGIVRSQFPFWEETLCVIAVAGLALLLGSIVLWRPHPSDPLKTDVIGSLQDLQPTAVSSSTVFESVLEDTKALRKMAAQMNDGSSTANRRPIVAHPNTQLLPDGERLKIINKGAQNIKLHGLVINEQALRYDPPIGMPPTTRNEGIAVTVTRIRALLRLKESEPIPTMEIMLHVSDGSGGRYTLRYPYQTVNIVDGRIRGISGSGPEVDLGFTGT